jgi:hypothetical protein
MSFTLSSIASNLNAIQSNLRRMERDAKIIARPVLFDEPAPATGMPALDPAAGPATDDLAGAMVDMLIAQRAVQAQLRVLEVADAMSGAVLDIGRARRR